MIHEARLVGECARRSRTLCSLLHERYPALARRIALEISRRARLIADHPDIGRAVGPDGVYRELAMPVLNAVYVFRYRIRKDDIRILRVFHSRERRDW